MAGELDNWSEYRRLVLAELDRLNKAITGLDEKLDRRFAEQSVKDAARDVDLLTLKLKATIYGAIAGAFLSAVITLGAAAIYKFPILLEHVEQSTPVQPTHK